MPVPSSVDYWNMACCPFLLFTSFPNTFSLTSWASPSFGVSLLFLWSLLFRDTAACLPCVQSQWHGLTVFLSPHSLSNNCWDLQLLCPWVFGFALKTLIKLSLCFRFILLLNSCISETRDPKRRPWFPVSPPSLSLMKWSFILSSYFLPVWGFLSTSLWLSQQVTLRSPPQ